MVPREMFDLLLDYLTDAAEKGANLLETMRDRNKAKVFIDVLTSLETSSPKWINFVEQG